MNDKRILLVDDNQVNLAILEELLSDDYETMSVESGEDAIGIAPEFKPDLVLLDVMMPGIDGYEVCSWFRSHPMLKPVKVIMLSAKASLTDVEQGLTAGADDYLTKPFDMEKLSNVVSQMLASE